MKDGYPAPIPPPPKIAQLPKALIDAYSDINALKAFIIRESHKLDWPSCSIPNAMGNISEENGISWDGEAHEILGILYDYFRIKTRENASLKEAHENEK